MLQGRDSLAETLPELEGVSIGGSVPFYFYHRMPADTRNPKPTVLVPCSDLLFIGFQSYGRS